METYKGKINEFVDWTTGVNSITNQTVSGVSSSNPISGQSIRELLQEHLKTPFITFDDDIKTGKTLFFSSQEALDQWKIFTNYNGDTENQEDAEKAALLVVCSIDLPATYKISGLLNADGVRYIIEGNSTSENAFIRMRLLLEDALGSTESDTITTTFVVTDSSGEVRYNQAEQIDTGVNWARNIYKYLQPGENTVDISFSANNHTAKSAQLIKIYLVSFTISSNFTGYYTPVGNGVPFSFTVRIKRSITSLPIKTTVTIDGNPARFTDTNHSIAEWNYAESDTEPSKRFDIYNIYEASTDELKRKHIMIIRSEMSDPETSTLFLSNTLVYEFEVAPETDELLHSYVNIAASIPSGSYNTVEIQDIDGTTKILPVLYTTQYVPSTIDWGYVTDSYSLNLQKNVTWAVRTGTSGNYIYQNIADILGIKQTKPDSLLFIPTTSCTFSEDNSYLVARIQQDGDVVDCAAYPLTVAKSQMLISEVSNYSLKLSAVGKTNASDTKNQWVDDYNNVTTTFSPGVTFDKQNGWDNSDNSLALKGTSSFATIDYCLFPSTYASSPYQIGTSGATIEIDFKPEYVSDEDDVLITIGNPSKGHIKITTNSAGFYANGEVVVKTNFKSGERIKLAFIFNRDDNGTKDDNLVYIVNNGILERTFERGYGILTDDTGNIKIGGSNSSVKVYMIRAYRFALTPKQALDNYMFDNSSNTELITRNDVYGQSSTVTYTGMSGKQDIIKIEGNLTDILHNNSLKKNATVNITRESNTDPSRNFTVLNCRIRNHGQSTLSYPITSMKFWLNKSDMFSENGVEYTPTFNCESQQYLGLGKNRYIMKAGAIPSNKFVLQANYADSSGTHNGSLLRLILDTWYNANFGTRNNPIYRLRTAPQLFASGTTVIHNDTRINESRLATTGEYWEEGVYNIDPNATTKQGKPIYKEEYKNKTWKDITGTDFPYTLRISADSFPCTVFYRDTSSDNAEMTLLGQYVFMDDKKSDFLYGERSIYKTDDLSDPFCLKAINSKKDDKPNLVWDNKNVLQIEVVYPNSPLTSYLSKEVASKYVLGEDEMTLIPAEDSVIRSFDYVLERDAQGIPTKYQWEEHFDVIYPDKDDITSEQFVQKIQPFHDFLVWITDVAELRFTGERLAQSGPKSYVTQAEMNKFTAEAHDHLDLYKLAAYYVFFLRFGLVDSVERNAQLKTYDGQHWHYEPWDMDIALGCANNGVISYEPPITRETTREGGYVFAGRALNQSNVLWDCLEAWDTWANTIVPEVAKALYDAGLTYDNAIKMFDEEYAQTWSETLYNESGHYKYIDARTEQKYLLYLNGARTSHRHWWLNKSMNYFDAKWECGDFITYAIETRPLKSVVSGIDLKIKIFPTENTFFKAVVGSDVSVRDVSNGLIEATVEPGGEAIIDLSGVALGDKDTLKIYGASSILKLDLSGLLNGNNTSYTDLRLKTAYNNVLGPQIKELILGGKCVDGNGNDIYTNPNATSYKSPRTIGANLISGAADDGDALGSLEWLDVIGWKSNAAGSGSWLSGLLSEGGYDRKNIKTLYAMGCDSATQFVTGISGNLFEDLRLPDTIKEFVFQNSSWENISFWNTVEDENDRTTVTYNKLSTIPATVNSIYLAGSTGKNECSLQLIKDWIDAIDASLENGHTEEDLYAALELKTLIVDQAYWGTGSVTLTYDDLIRISHFGKGGLTYPIKGYVVIQPDLTGLTSARLAYLQSVFGENVFNLGTTNSNLVVDYIHDSIVISISSIRGEKPLLIDGDSISIYEPSSAKLSANKFTLTSGNANNQIAESSGSNDPNVNSNFTENKYIWGFVEALDSPVGSSMSGLSTYASLERGSDGIIRLKTREGNGNNYTLYIRVMYGKLEGGNTRIVADTIAVNVIGVTYPTDYVWSVTSENASVQQFRYTETVAKDLFGSAWYNAYGNNANVYVINEMNQKFEFSLLPSEPKYYTDSVTGLRMENWTANQDNEHISYFVKQYSGGFQISNWMARETFAADSDSQLPLGSGTYVNVLYKATRGGIPVKSVIALPENPVLYQISGSVQIGGKEQVIKDVFFIVINDPTPVITGSSSLLSVKTWAAYTALYNIPNISAQNMYKFHLLGLNCNIDFSEGIDDQNKISSLITNNMDSILNYIPYITGLNFENCTNLSETELDLTNCPILETLNTKGTSLGVILPYHSKITTMVLGSPIKVVLDTPLTLGEPGTTYTVEGRNNLADLYIQGVNTNNVRGFALFNKIYKTV